MMIQWRAGLRVSEVITLTPADVNFAAEPQPELKVRMGKGSKDRLVPLHHELGASLSTAAMFMGAGKNDPYIPVTRQTIDSWYKAGFEHAREIGALPYGKPVTTHTFRHSAARHWLLSGVPLSIVSQWLGHANLSTTMVYLQMISDPGGFMARVP
jgi:integrase/recombinase XerD